MLFLGLGEGSGGSEASPCLGSAPHPGASSQPRELEMLGQGQAAGAGSALGLCLAEKKKWLMFKELHRAVRIARMPRSLLGRRALGALPGGAGACCSPLLCVGYWIFHLAPWMYK